MVDRTRNTIRKQIAEFTYNLEGTIEEVIADLQTYAANYPGARLVYEETSSAYDDNRYGYRLYSENPETDAEMAVRIAREELRERGQENYRRRLYEALKAEFEGESGK